MNQAVDLPVRNEIKFLICISYFLSKPKMSKIPDYTLNNGSIIPSIGLGSVLRSIIELLKLITKSRCWMGGVGGGQRVNDMIEQAIKVFLRHNSDRLMS